MSKNICLVLVGAGTIYIDGNFVNSVLLIFDSTQKQTFGFAALHTIGTT